MATVIEVMAKLTGNASGMIATFKQAQSAARDTANQTKITGEQAKASFDSLTLPAGVIAGGVAVIGTHLATMASEAEQNVGAVESVFKQYADTVKDASSKAAEDVGISQSAYQQFASVVGSQLKNMGTPLSEVAGGTDMLIKKGADLASMFGGTTSEAVEALSSMLRGETDPIERYGVSINEAAVEAKMAEMGLKGLTGEAETNAKLQAKLALLTEQTADATGNFAREGDTAAGAMQRANARWEDAQSTLGTALLPIMTKAAELLAGLAKFASQNSAALLVMGGLLGTAALALLSMAGALKAYTIAADAAKVATYLFGTAQKAIMAFSIIGIIMLIVGAFAYLWMTSEGFRAFWINLWNELVKACEPFTTAVTGAFNAVMKSIGQFLGDVGKAAEGIWSILTQGDFKGGIFGLEEDSGFVTFLLDLHGAVESVFNILTKGDFTGPIFGLEEDSPLVSFLLDLHGAAESVFNIFTKGDFTGPIFGLQEDSALVDFLFRLKDGVSDVWNILVNGDFTGHLFGLEEDSALVDWLFDIRDAAKTIWDFLTTGKLTGPIFGLESNPAFLAFLVGLKENAEGAIQWVQNLAKGIGDFLGGLVQGGGEDIFAAIQNSNIIPWIQGLWDRAKVIFDQLSAAWAKVWEFISNAFQTIGPPLFAYIMAAFQMLWQAVVGIWNAVGQPLINIIVAAWNILVDGIVAVWNIIVGVVQGAMSIIEGIIAVVTGIITGNWQQVWEGLGKILGGVWQIITSVIGNALAFIGSIISNGLNIIVNIWNGIWGAVGAVLGAVFANIGNLIGTWLGVLGAVVASVFGGVWDNITGAWNGLMGWWNGLWGGFVGMFTDWWNSLAQGASEGATAVTSPIVDGFNAVAEFFNTIFTAIGNAVSAAWTWITTLILDIFNAFWATHGAQLTGMWNFIVSIFTAIQTAISTAWNAVVAFIVAGIMGIVNPVVAGFTAVWNFIVTVFNAVGAAISTAWNFYVSIIRTVLSAIWGVISSVFNNVRNFITSVFSAVWGFLSGVWNNIVAAISGAVARVYGFISSGFNNAWAIISSVFGRVVGFLGGIWGQVTAGVSGMVGRVGGFFSGMWGTITGALSGAGTWLLNAGRQVVQGFINGIQGLAGTIGNAFLSMVPGWIVGPFKKALGIASPSKLFHQFGRWIIEGLINGVHAKGDGAKKAVQSVADKLTKGAQEHLKRYDALMKKARNTKLPAGERASALADARAEGRMQGQLQRAANMVQAQVRRVDQLAKQKVALSQRLKDAQKKLNDAISVRNKKAQSTSADLQKEFDLGALVGFSGKDVVKQTQLIGARIRNFGTKIQQLKKAGLSAAMIDQVTQLGSVDGTVMADSLLKGGKGVIAQMNSAYAGIKSSSDAAGSMVADGMYKAGIDSARGLVAGIQSQIKRVDGAATQIAKTLISRFRKELGIKSPSRVMMQDGGHIMEGAAIGVERNAGRLLGAVAGAAQAVANTEFAPPAISLPKVPDIAAQLALPTLEQRVRLIFEGTSPAEAIKNFEAKLQTEGVAGGLDYNRAAIGGTTTVQPEQPQVTVDMTVMVQNPWGEGYLEAKVVQVAEKASNIALKETARAAKGKRGGTVGGW